MLPDAAPAQTGVILGLANIGKVFGRSRWSIARWIREHGMPAARLPDGTWFTTMGLNEAWIMERRAQDPLVRQAASDGEGQ